MPGKKNQTVDIDSLERFTMAIGSYHQYLIQDFKGKLFHYTDLEALRNIVGNHDLWLTNSRYSNDEHEMDHGYEIARKVIDRKRQGSGGGARQAYLDKVAALVNIPPPRGVYICCFCEEDNLLSQWRGYGDSGTGVSIAFNPGGFASYSGPDMPPERLGLTRLWKVFYNDDIQEDIVEKALDMIPDLNVDDSDEVHARKAADAIHFFIPTFKNKDFKEEKERRLIFTPAPGCIVEPSYRVARGMLVPYYSLKALGKELYGSENRLPVTGVTLGPSVRQALNVDSVKMLLARCGYKGVSVCASATPFRG